MQRRRLRGGTATQTQATSNAVGNTVSHSTTVTYALQSHMHTVTQSHMHYSHTCTTVTHALQSHMHYSHT